MKHYHIISWIILITYGIWMFVISPRIRGTNREEQFFTGKDETGKEATLFFLTSSLLISWIFAKSIQNAANLGQAFGLPGGVAYATYWLAFITAGFILFSIRKNGFKSIHHFLRSKFGQSALWIFSFILLFRLWNEIWSNTMVIGQFFGDAGTFPYYCATWVATMMVVAYALKGGMRSSIMTDAIQMVLATVILMVILAFILPQGHNIAMLNSGSWTLAGGVDLILVALIQIWSYPFHDPVMTDRAFITEPKKMLTGFIWAGILGFIFILLFSFTGIFNMITGIEGNSTIDTAKYFGLPLLLIMNIIMITSATSTLDSTFASSGKLVAKDLMEKFHINKVILARATIIILALLGNIMVHLDPSILSATTVSGTMVIGLTPVFVLHQWKKPGAASYWASVLVGLVFGIGYALGWFDTSIGAGKYGKLLWVNVTGVSLSFILFTVLAFIAPKKNYDTIKN